MIKKLLEHSVRKDLRRANKKHTHNEYMRALNPIPKAAYWAGYHKKKLIALAILGIVSWTYDWYRSMYRYALSLESPQRFLKEVFTTAEKVPKTITEQVVVWEFAPESKSFLEKLYYEADRRLIFGVSRNYLFKVYHALGLLQKPEEERNFWVSGGFYRKRNQLISGVGLGEFLTLFEESFRELRKSQPDLNEQTYLKDFASLFVQKGGEIFEWQKEFNKKRYNEFLKSLLTENEIKQDEISTIMRENLDVSEQQVEVKLQSMGMKGMSVRERWLYWRNREILLSLREEALLKRISFGISEDFLYKDLKKRQQLLSKELQDVEKKKNELKQLHLDLYEEQLI